MSLYIEQNIANPLSCCRSVINSYRVTLVRLFRAVHRIRKRPWLRAKEVLSIQEDIVRRISYIERRIRLKRACFNEIKKVFAVKSTSPTSKQKSNELKKQMAEIHLVIQDYQDLIKIFRDIGNGLVFIFLGKYDVKPMSFKQSPGFLSGKKGLRLELKTLRRLFRSGEIAILTDITNCLRYGDIVIVTNGRPRIVEVKHSYPTNPRAIRQLANSFNMQNYLFSDLTNELFGKDIVVKRVQCRFKERNHIKKLNALIEYARLHGSAFEQIEQGLYYFTAYEVNFARFNTELAKFAHPPAVFFLNQFKLDNTGFYPFTLSILSPEALFDFYAGNLCIMVMVEHEILIEKFAHYGLYTIFKTSPEAMIITHEKPINADIPKSISISSHFFARLAFEFVGINWFVKEVLHKFNLK